jgi:hypothetical protein
MNIARAFGLVAVWSVALAQEAAPLRFTVALDTITQYGGKSETSTGQSFVFATGPDGSSRVPDGLKAAFERGQLTRYGLIAGSQVSYFNETQTVHDVLEDGSRVVLVEQVSQNTAALQLGAAQKIFTEMTRTYKPNGSIKLEDVFVNVEGVFHRNEETNQQILLGVAENISNSQQANAQILEACYETQPGSSAPLKLDPEPLQLKRLDPKDLQINDNGFEPVRVGDVRLQTVNGNSECRISINPSQYGLKQDRFKFVQRQIMKFANDGQIERNEFISSVTYGEMESSDFEFEGKTYRVRSIPVSRTTGSTDRLR